jgi:SAM-dependent MidA family methyltransferase
MERALYEPGRGYYRQAAPGPGTAGDFLTAPEAHPVYGAALGRLVDVAWTAMGRPIAFTVTEPGAGTGALAAGLLGGLRDAGSPLAERVQYRPVEVEPARLEALATRLRAAGLEGALVTDEPADAPATTAVETGAVIANEVLDALPVHRVIGRGDGLRELLVTTTPDGGFGWLEAEPSTSALAARLETEGVTLGDGQITEVCLGIDSWLAEATRHLARGVVVLVDYAAEPAQLHGAAKPDGTLRAFARHAVGGDPFRNVGRQDLTATVDLAAVRAAASKAGLGLIGETTQAELLAAAANPVDGRPGLTDPWLRGPDATLESALHLRSALARLMDPRGMGGFRVLVFGRGLPADLRLPLLDRLRRPGV